MDEEFEKLIELAKEIAIRKKLNVYATCGQVGCALLTKSGKIYTGISMELKCNLGNCAEHAAVIEMLKNKESEISKIVAYSSRGGIYAPCGRCREVIRMINENNLSTEVMVAENKVTKLKDLLPEIYTTKDE